MGTNNQGNWVGKFGVDGYALGGWYSTTDDLVALPNASLTVVQGSRWVYSTNTTDARALQPPTGTTRHSTTWYDNNLQLRLNFPSAYAAR